MRVSCPNCHTEYEVPDAALAVRPRTLRCDSCKTKWQVAQIITAEPEAGPEAEPEEPETRAVEAERATEANTQAGTDGDAKADASMAETAPEPPAPRVTPPPGRRSTQPARPGLARPGLARDRGLQVSVLLLILVIVAILLEHRAIGHVWPPSLRLFHLLGLR